MSSIRKAISTNLEASQSRKSSTAVVARPALFKPYSSYTYNLISCVDTAKSVFDQRDGMSIVKEQLRPLFQKHGLQDNFGAGLIYRHFDLGPDERLVEYNGTATPWQCRECFLGRKIVPIAWLFDGDHLLPYDFRFPASSEDMEQAAELKRQAAFLDEVHHVLRKSELDWGLGLRGMPVTGKESLLEVSQQKANITIPQSELPEDKHNKSNVETMWFFDKKSDKRYACNYLDVMVSHRHH